LIASEDAAFYEHDGIDWDQMERAWDERQKRGRLRGASTISQQVVKNLFLTNHRNPIRKGAEFALTPAAEFLWPKERILELYLNVIEWGPGVYGAEAAAQYHYRIPAARLSREQSARLAAIVPSPLRRRPAVMNRYSGIILRRMATMGW
jgi:monofunctional biosynthetic peptidoglycan transglycosylase